MRQNLVITKNIKIEKSEVKFQPINISFTIETIEELQGLCDRLAMYHIDIDGSESKEEFTDLHRIISNLLDDAQPEIKTVAQFKEKSRLHNRIASSSSVINEMHRLSITEENLQADILGFYGH
jgi:hypothetical protein